MLKRIGGGICCLMMAVVAHASDVKKLEFESYGFSIAPLDQSKGDFAGSALALFLPADHGFSPNVNVQIQPFTGSIEDYAKLSKKQFVEIGFKLINESYPAKDTLVLEYSGASGPRTLRWYSRGVLRKGKVFLATATSSIEAWPKLSKTLVNNVNSLTITE